MKVNWPEKIWVNSPMRLMVQKWETRFFQGLHDMPPGSACLEIGCGRGAAVLLMSRWFSPLRIDALDIDPEMVRRAMGRRRATTPHGLIMAADAQVLPYRDQCLDAVFNFGIIHHLERWKLGLEEIARVLRKGGRFYFEEIYAPLYANRLLRHVLAHPRENRFHGPEFRAAMDHVGLDLLQGYHESRFAILGVAVKR
ncbi:MAG: class I SAM-dependent methyltransferase [Deltaproteobacteria bacterium HGW-Deltaproteobacteria-21]|nr:MAG: class I SAM-dependent methyltransferase [Deltaproteobacteria bacterium HGW-Deltaproteobacteria-21]